MRCVLAIGCAAVLLAGSAAAASAPPSPYPHVVEYTFHSKLLGRNLHESLAIPGSSRGRELLVYLHGYGEATGFASTWMLSTLQELGAKAPVVLFADDVNLTSWWHDRESGKWGSYVLDELIPAALARTKADPTRVVIGGVSMGGFGALNLAHLEPGRFCAIGALSPALFTPDQWRHSFGAFDSDADYARNDLLSLARRLHLYFSPVYLTVGRTESIRPAVTSFAKSLRAVGTEVTFQLVPGRTGDFGKRMPAFLRWAANACPRKA